MSAEEGADRAPVRDRRFLRYWTAQSVSQLGDRVSELAIPLIAITTLQAGPVEVGLLTGAVWAPHLLSLLTGSWVDRRERKQSVLVWADLIQAMAVLSLPIAFAVNRMSLVQLFLVALVAGFGRTLYQTAYPTFFVALVSRNRYVEANSLLSTSRSGSFIVGPALGGLLIQVLSAPVAMLIDGLSFLLSALMIRGVKVRERIASKATAGTPDLSITHRAADGMRYLWRDPHLSASLRCCTAMNFFNFVAAALVLLFASRQLHLSAGAIGLALGIGSAGGLIGAILAPRFGRRWGAGATICLGGVLFSAPMALVPLASGSTASKAAVLAVAQAIGAFGIMLFDINLNAVQTAVIPDHMRSRVSGAFASVNYGIRPLGGLVGGIAGSILGVGPTLVVAAVGGSLSVIFLLCSPIARVRDLADLTPPRVVQS